MNFYLIYKGEYLNEKRNGKGKKFRQNELEFEGEFLNGQEWNGKKYDENGNIEYELKDGKDMLKNMIIIKY